MREDRAEENRRHLLLLLYVPSVSIARFIGAACWRRRVDQCWVMTEAAGKEVPVLIIHLS